MCKTLPVSHLLSTKRGRRKEVISYLLATLFLPSLPPLCFSLLLPSVSGDKMAANISCARVSQRGSELGEMLPTASRQRSIARHAVSIQKLTQYRSPSSLIQQLTQYRCPCSQSLQQLMQYISLSMQSLEQLTQYRYPCSLYNS